MKPKTIQMNSDKRTKIVKNANFLLFFFLHFYRIETINVKIVVPSPADITGTRHLKFAFRDSPGIPRAPLF